MWRILVAIPFLFLSADPALRAPPSTVGAQPPKEIADAKPPISLWFEPEWFEGVKGSFAYWTGTAKPTGSWVIAGPGISPECTQGGESEWNAMGAAAAETKARCQRDFIVPRATTYMSWVRYVGHPTKTDPLPVTIHPDGKL